MKIQMLLECECGNRETVSLKRTTDGRYSYLEVSESLEKSTRFKAKQTSPDETRITCLQCQKHQDVLI